MGLQREHSDNDLVKLYVQALTKIGSTIDIQNVPIRLQARVIAEAQNREASCENSSGD